MDLLQLETFIRLVQHRSFSRVAKELGVSQPMVTIRIKKLEEQLGVALIVRVSHKVKITPAGQVFYDYIERSMRIMRHGINRISHNREWKRQLSIAATPTVSMYLLPPLLVDYYRQNPAWSISMETGYTSEVIEKVLDDVVDIGFITSSFHHPDIIKIPLFKDQFYLTVHASHPLADQPSITHFDLNQESLYTYPIESKLYFKIMYLLREIGITCAPSMEVRNPEVIKRMILAGNGIAFLPWITIKKEVAKGTLVVLPFELPRPLERQISMIFKKQNNQLPQVTGFFDLIDKILFVKM